GAISERDRWHAGSVLWNLEGACGMKIAKEPLTPELLAEITPLAQKCWDESTQIKGESCAYHDERDFLIEPDGDQYLTLASVAALTVITLRNEGKLEGYLVGILYRSLHHRKILCGLGDSMYLEPQHRFAYAASVAQMFESEMRAKGAGIIGWPANMKS